MISRFSPWPASAFTRMHYSDNRILTLGTGGPLNRLEQYNLNDLIAQTGDVGPYGVPEWSTMYARYCVHAVSIDVTFWVPNASASTDELRGRLFIIPSPSNGGAYPNTSGIEELSATRLGTHRPFGSVQGSRSVIRMKKFISIRKLEGRKIKGEEEYQGTLNPSGGGTAPNNLCTVQIGWAPLAGLGTQRQLTMLLKMTYYVHLFNANVASAFTGA